MRGADDDHDLRARCSLDPPAGRRGGAADARGDLPPAPRGRRPGGGRPGDPRWTRGPRAHRRDPSRGRARPRAAHRRGGRARPPPRRRATSTRPACSSRRRSSTPTSTPSTRCSCPARSPASSCPAGRRRVLADPVCIANVLGARGMDLVASTSTPMRVFAQVTPDVPRRGRDGLNGAHVTQAEILERVTRPSAVSVGESNPFNLDEEMAEVLSVAIGAGKRATGHTARLSGEPLWAYAAGGVGDDHNAATLEEVIERLRLGMIVTLQAGSMSDYCEAILGRPDLLGLIGAHLAFCADDKHVEDLHDQGAIDHHVRSAVALGVAPELAIRMGSLNAAAHFRIDHLVGSLTPSRLADLQLLPDLETFRPGGGVGRRRRGRTRRTADVRQHRLDRSGVARHRPPRAATADRRARRSSRRRRPVSCRRWRCTTATTSGPCTLRSTSSTGRSCRTRRTTSPRSAWSTATTRPARRASGSSVGSACAAARSPRRPTATTRTS